MNRLIVLLTAILILPGCLPDCPGIPLEASLEEPLPVESSTSCQATPFFEGDQIEDLGALIDANGASLPEQEKDRQTCRFTTSDFNENWEFRDEWGERTYTAPITCNNDIDLHIQKHTGTKVNGIPYTCDLTVKNISAKSLQIDLKSRHFEVMFADVREYVDDEDESSQDRHTDSSKCITLAGLNLDGTTLHPGEEVVMFIEIEQELSQGRYDVYIAYEKKVCRNWGRSDAAISNIISLVVE